MGRYWIIGLVACCSMAAVVHAVDIPSTAIVNSQGIDIRVEGGLFMTDGDLMVPADWRIFEPLGLDFEVSGSIVRFSAEIMIDGMWVEKNFTSVFK